MYYVEQQMYFQELQILFAITSEKKKDTKKKYLIRKFKYQFSFNNSEIFSKLSKHLIYLIQPANYE